MGYVNDYSLAQDMAQETFIKVWQYLPTFRNEANIDTWIFRIATNNCLRQLERKKQILSTQFPADLFEDEKADIAQIIGLSESNVRVRIHRIKVQLTRKFKEYGE